ITVEKVDEETVKLSTEEPYLQLPAIVTNPALGIVNSELAQENGATTDNDDEAEEFFNSASAGSGPYMIDSLDITSQVVLVPNPEYDGEYTPEFERVVVRNVSESSTQLINLQGGDSNLAVDLNGDQVESLGEGLKVTSQPSAPAMFLLINPSTEDAGAHTRGFARVGVRPASGSSPQLINLQGGDSNLAVDLNGDQVESLGEGLKVTSQPSAQAMFLLINQSEEVGGDTANPDFAE